MLDGNSISRKSSNKERKKNLILGRLDYLKIDF